MYIIFYYFRHKSITIIWIHAVFLKPKFKSWETLSDAASPATLKPILEMNLHTQKRPVNDLQAAFKIPLNTWHHFKTEICFLLKAASPIWHLCPRLPMPPQAMSLTFRHFKFLLATCALAMVIIYPFLLDFLYAQDGYCAQRHFMLGWIPFILA